MFIFEAQVFQLCFDREKTQTMCQRSVEVKRFSRNLELFGGKHRTQGSHIMQTVGNLNQDHTDIVTHGEQ